MNKITKIYDKLDKHFGDLKWWPAETAFEVMVGAVLTQNTAWTNVEKAIRNMKKEGFLKGPGVLARSRENRIAKAIKPSGYYNIKAKRLKALCCFLEDECHGEISRLRSQESRTIRKKLLSVNGIGPETADSMLLYALGKPVFVVDTYTKRIFSRHGILPEDSAYDEVQMLAHKAFPKDVKKLNQFHALLVEAAKNFCKKSKPLCEECPLRGV